MSKKDIFVIHNHKNFSGSARSLGELIKSLEKKINFSVICPEGSSSKYFKEININVFNVMKVPRFNHFELGHYRGIRWFLLFRELIAFIYFLWWCTEGSDIIYRPVIVAFYFTVILMFFAGLFVLLDYIKSFFN